MFTLLNAAKGSQAKPNLAGFNVETLRLHSATTPLKYKIRISKKIVNSIEILPFENELFMINYLKGMLASSETWVNVDMGAEKI